MWGEQDIFDVQLKSILCYPAQPKNNIPTRDGLGSANAMNLEYGCEIVYKCHTIINLPYFCIKYISSNAKKSI